MLRVPDGKLERVDFDSDVLDFEHRGLVFIRRDEMDGRRDALPTENDVRQPRVAELRDTRLLPEPKSNVPHIRLHLRKRQRELVVVLVLDGLVGGELDKVVCLDGDDVGEEVSARKCKVLDNKVQGIGQLQ